MRSAGVSRLLTSSSCSVSKRPPCLSRSLTCTVRGSWALSLLHCSRHHNHRGNRLSYCMSVGCGLSLDMCSASLHSTCALHHTTTISHHPSTSWSDHESLFRDGVAPSACRTLRGTVTSSDVPAGILPRRGVGGSLNTPWRLVVAACVAALRRPFS